MAGGKFSLANLFGMTIRESANDGSDFTNPDADYRRLFLGEDGLLHVKDSAGTVTNPFSGSGPLDNLSASAAPTVNDDTGDGYSVGSTWCDTTNDRIYQCIDASSGAAIWLLTGVRREVLAAIWSVEVVKTDIGTSYVDVYSGGNNFAQLIYVDFTGFTQFRAYLIWDNIGAGTQSLRIVDASSVTDVLHDFTAAVDGGQDSGLVTIPAHFVGSRFALKLMAKSTTAGDDPAFRGLRLYLK